MLHSADHHLTFRMNEWKHVFFYLYRIPTISAVLFFDLFWQGRKGGKHSAGGCLLRLDLGSRGNINFNTETFSLQMQCPLYTQFVKIRIRSRRLDFEVETLLLHISYLSAGVLILCILILLILTGEKCEKSVLPCSSGWWEVRGGPGL